MKQYLYSLLLLTALSSQLNGMNENLKRLGVNQEEYDRLLRAAKEDIKGYDRLVREGKYSSARSKICIFLYKWQLHYVARVMADPEVSPLMTAVKFDKDLLVNAIITSDKFNEIDKGQRTQFLRDALNLANQLGHAHLSSLLKQTLDEAQQESDEDDEDQDEDIN